MFLTALKRASLDSPSHVGDLMSADASSLRTNDFYRTGPDVFQQRTQALQLAEGAQNRN
jgi:hypothetical protein